MCNYLGNIDLPDKAFSRLTSLLPKVKRSGGVCVSYFSPLLTRSGPRREACTAQGNAHHHGRDGMATGGRLI